MEMQKVQNYVKSKEEFASKNKVQCKDFCTPAAGKGLFIGIALMTLNIYSGAFILINYAGSIFKASGSDIDPNMSAIIMMTIQLVGTYVATFVVDRFGRRILMIISTLGTAIGLGAMGTYTFLATENVELSSFAWVPIVSISCSMFFVSLGIMPLGFVILAEVLPSKVY